MLGKLINTNRKGWVDALRGLAILLVIFGHCAPDLTSFFVLTSPIKMPIFFVISGYVLNESIEIKQFFVKLVKKIVVPWLVLGLLFPIILIPFNGLSYLVDYLCKMLSGEILWFMPCFIVGQSFHFVFRKYLKIALFISLVSFVCFFVGLILSKKGLLDYAMINTSLVVQPFFVLGYLFKKYEQIFVRTEWKWIFGLLILYFITCGLSMLFFPGQTIDVHLNRYFNVPYCLLTIILGCFILFVIARKSSYSSFIMSFIGQNTLILYMWHGMAIIVLVKLASLIGFNMQANGWTALVKTLWAAVSCGVCAGLLNKYIPFAVGKNKKP